MHIAVGMLLALVLAACGTTAPSPVPQVVVRCDPARWDPPAALTCDAAVNAAAVAIQPISRGPVTVVTFRYGSWCPPNARCAVVMPDRGYVVFEFADRLQPLMVDVALEEGLARAGEVRPAPVEWTQGGREPVRG